MTKVILPMPFAHYHFAECYSVVIHSDESTSDEYVIPLSVNLVNVIPLMVIMLSVIVPLTGFSGM